MNGGNEPECEDELEAVKEENRRLREASRTFGALADRLSDRLREVERRMSTRDRRETPDRRHGPSDLTEPG